jgi:hypothetical protein
VPFVRTAFLKESLVGLFFIVGEGRDYFLLRVALGGRGNVPMMDTKSCFIAQIAYHSHLSAIAFLFLKRSILTL